MLCHVFPGINIPVEVRSRGMRIVASSLTVPEIIISSNVLNATVLTPDFSDMADHSLSNRMRSHKTGF